MPFSEDRKRKVWVPLVISMILALGFGLGVIAQRYLFKTKPLDKFINREDPIDEIITLIDKEYVDSVNSDSLYLEAVNGILNNLDPHTVYIPANQLVHANELLEGSGKGIGIDYYFLNDTLLVTALDGNGPAARSGLKLGDKIIRVNNKIIAGPDVTEEEAVSAFRTRSDTISVQVLPYSAEKTTTLRIVKGNIRHNSVASSYMLSDKQTGYIRLTIFSSNSYNDIVEALQQLLDQGMKSLIFDMRGNGGGYFEEAIAIADEFLDGDKLIVFTNGKKEGKYEYNAGIEGIYEKGKLIILQDENTASASEVLAGAIQDWDRGLIIGVNSYGKGLVQEQYELSDGSAIRITTSRYYTPTGRTIQRPYSKGREAYDEAYYAKLSVLDSNGGRFRETGNAPVFYTLISHRAIYGNGGISPDIISRTNLRAQSPELQQIMAGDIFNKFVNTYYFNTFKRDFLYGSFEAYNKQFKPQTVVMNEMYASFLREDATNTKIAWKNSHDLEYLAILLKAHIAKLAFGTQSFYYVLNENDSTIIKAREIISSGLYNSLLKSKAISKR